MPKLQLTVFEPIEIEIIGSGIYKIETLSSRMLGEFQAAIEEYGNEPGNLKAEQIGEMLSKMLPGLTKEKAMEIDIRHVARIAEFLAAQITESAQPGKVKN